MAAGERDVAVIGCGALKTSASANFPALWEKMCRYSFHMYESYLGIAGNPVEWTDRYALSDTKPAERMTDRQRGEALEFAEYEDRIADLTPLFQDLPP
ncbi:MAG TPA: hypothetical protein VGI90_12410, partial [Steroidobacteraceae bacterium]